MTFKVDHLLGREFVMGSQDCYGLVRDFYKDNFGLSLRNYARPLNFWGEGLDLYSENFHAEGFRVVNDHPKDYRPGDAILMAIKATVANHAAIIMEDGNILHHLYGCRSVIETYNRPLYRDTTLMVLRHPKVEVLIPEVVTTKQDLMDLLPESLKQRLTPYVPAG